VGKIVAILESNASKTYKVQGTWGSSSIAIGPK